MADVNPQDNQEVQATTEQVVAPGQTQAPTQVTTTTSAQPESKMAKLKKMMMLIIGGVVAVWALLVGIGFSMVGVGGQGSSLASLMSMPPRDAIGKFSLFAYALFGFVAFLVLIYFLIALIQMVRTPKEDITRKSKSIKTWVSGIALIFVLGGWLASFMFLAGRAETFSNVGAAPSIVTEPKSTLGLSAPVIITFDATGFASKINVQQYTIVSYLWDFGDNTTGTGPVVSHEYTDKGRNAGVFEATLAVTLQDRAEKQIIMKGTSELKTTVSIKNIKPTVIFSASPEKGAAPLTVNFDASDSTDPDGQITGYAWDLEGKGEFTKGLKTATHTYTTSGKYEVALQLTDNSEDTNVVKRIIDVSDSFAVKGVIDLQTEDSGKLTIGKSYLFDAKRSGSPNGKITKYMWNFGDNTPVQSGRSVSHAYAKAGQYEASLVVTDEAGASATSTKKVSVVEPSKTPTSLISSTPAAVGGKITGAAPLTVDFDGTKSLDPDNNIVEYAWDFNGDNAPDKFGPQASYTFEQKGTYTVALKITDADNNERTAQVTVEATPPGIQAKINATPVSGVVPLTVKFDASASTYLDGQIISYEWDFGDGSPKRQDAAKISYKYNKVGIYTAKVTAIGSDGKKATNSLTVTVQNIPVKACFTTNKTEANAPAEIVFNANCSTGTIAKYNWDIDGNGLFNDGSGPQVSNTFKDPGTYNISLEVTDTQGVVDSFTDAIIIK